MTGGEQYLIALSRGRTLVAGTCLAPAKSREWIVLIPESGSEFRSGSRAELRELVGPMVSKHYNFLAINKPGVFESFTDRALFEESFRRKLRINDALTAMNQVIPRGDRIVLLGYSEGAYLAPQVALRDPRVKSVGMIGGGTRGWLKEELNQAPKRQQPRLRELFQQMRLNPSARLKWKGFSYATWDSYRADSTLKALRQLDIPVIAVLGARDRVIDLKSTIYDLVLISEHKPIQIHIFGDCGHHFSRHWPQVGRVMGRFLSEPALKKTKKPKKQRTKT